MRILPVILLLLTLSAFAQDDLDVSCPIPQGWTGGSYRTDSNRWAASIKREGPIHLEASLVVSRVDPSARLGLGYSSMDRQKFEETTFQGYPCKVYRRRDWVDPNPYAQYRIVEADFYHVRVSEQLTVEIYLYREAWERTQEDRILDLGPARREIEHLYQQQSEALASLRFIFPTQSVPTDAAPSAPEPLPETEIPWATVIGAGGAVVLASALVLAAKRKPTATSTPVAAQAPPVYVLQLSSNHLNLSQTAPSSLSVAVWKVDPVSKTYHPASDAIIEMPPLPELPQLRLNAQPSPGKVVYQLQLTGPCSSSGESLSVSARAGGSLHSARVRLSFAPTYTLEFF